MATEIKNIDPNDPKLSIGSFNEIANQARGQQTTLISGSHFSSLGILTRLIKSVGVDIRIFEVDENGTGDGIYNCHEKLVVDADWDLTNGAAKIWDKDDPPVSVEVLNLDEHNPSAGQHNLVAGDILAAWQATDDEGTKRWVGVPAMAAGTGIYKAFCKTDADKKTTIVCYLDENITSPPQDPPPTEITVHCSVASQPKSIEAITLSNPISIKITAHRFVTDVTVRLVSIVDISPSLNGEYVVIKIDADNFTLNAQPKAIEDIILTGTEPVNIKLSSHGFATDGSVTLADIAGITPSLDGEYVITKIDADNFTLNGTDSSGYTGTFVSGTVSPVYTGTFVSGTACGVDLDESIPRLTKGLEISVWKDGNTWKCFWGFQHWEPYIPICP